MCNPRGFMRRIALAVCYMIGSITTAAAQDMEPRAYVASPVGLHFLAVGFGRSTGGVVIDPSLPLTDVRASVNSGSVGIGTTMNLFGRTALVVAGLPYAWAKATGRVGENEALGSVSRSGLADARARLSVNLLGGRALSPLQFARTPRSPTIVGVSLSIVPPSGQYYPTKLINLGSNRWSFKPE